MNDTTEILRELELELLRPEVRTSIHRLNELLADEFEELGASGIKYRKQDVITSLSNAAEEQFTLQDSSVRSLPQDIYLTTYRIEQTIPKTDTVLHSLRSSIWKKSHGRWQMVFHQGTRCSY